MNPPREEALFEAALEKQVDKRTAFFKWMCDGDEHPC
jgi:hypothetical protein